LICAIISILCNSGDSKKKHTWLDIKR
jgi:hypothetical protein